MAYRPAGTASSWLWRASRTNARALLYSGAPGRPVPFLNHITFIPVIVIVIVAVGIVNVIVIVAVGIMNVVVFILLLCYYLIIIINGLP